MSDRMSVDERVLRMLNIGYGNVVAGGRVVAIVSPQSAPMKRGRGASGRARANACDSINPS